MAALTTTQARDMYIIDSVVQFLSRNIKSAYETEMATYTTSSYDISAALKIMQADPSDSSVTLHVPTIAVEDTGASFRFPDVGSNMSFRYMTLVLYCWPAVNSVDTQPSDQAAAILKAYLRNVLSTYSFQIIDYSNPDCNADNIIYCSENAIIDKFVMPTNRMKTSPNAMERNRFEVYLTICYPVMEQLVS